MDSPRVIQGDHSLLTYESTLDWFRALTVEERYAVLESHLDVITELRPELLDRHASDPSRSVRVIRLPQR